MFLKSFYNVCSAQEWKLYIICFDSLRDVTEGLSVRNPYRWLPRKDVTKDKKDGKKSKEKEKGLPNAPSEEEHIKKVTQVWEI